MFTFIVRLVILIFVVANPKLRALHRKQLIFPEIALVSIPAQLKESSIIPTRIVNSDHNGLSPIRDFHLNILSPLHDQFGGSYSPADFDKANRLLAEEQFWIYTPDVKQALDLQSWGNVFKTIHMHGNLYPKGCSTYIHESPLAIKELKTCNAKVKTLYSKGQSHQDQLSSGENIMVCLNIEKLKTGIL